MLEISHYRCFRTGKRRRPPTVFCPRSAAILTKRFWVVAWVLLIALGGLMSFASEALAEGEGTAKISGEWIGLTILILFAIVALLVFYMVYLQRKFLEVCREEKQLTTFFQTPAGLPAGTVRAILTFVIVCFSLYLITLGAFGVGGEFPETLAAVLSTIIGFYFGSRTAIPREGAMAEELERTRKERNEALSAKDEGKAAELLKKVGKNVRLVKSVLDVLPEDMKSKYGGTLQKLEQGMEVADDLLNKGQTAGAAEKAEEMFKLFKGDNPLRDTVLKAMDSFGKAAGTVVPAFFLISAVVGISTQVIGARYAKWKARILNTPFSPAEVPLKVVDADTGFVLILQSPIFKEAFRQKLEEQDRRFIETSMRDLLTKETTELWETYNAYFDSQEHFEKGLQEFRSRAADLELEGEIEPALLRDTGGYAPLMTAIDKIQRDDKARADLDLLVETIEGLQKANEPVKSIFDKVLKEVQG